MQPVPIIPRLLFIYLLFKSTTLLTPALITDQHSIRAMKEESNVSSSQVSESSALIDA